MLHLRIKSNIVSNLLDSVGVKGMSPNRRTMKATDLGENISNSTYYLSCWATFARWQLEERKIQKRKEAEKGKYYLSYRRISKKLVLYEKYRPNHLFKLTSCRLSSRL